jgi:hypothetical protein
MIDANEALTFFAGKQVFHLCVMGFTKCSTSYSLRAVVRTSATRHCLISYSSYSQTSHRVPLTAVQWDTNSQNNNWRNDTVGSQKFCFICLGTYGSILPKSLILNNKVFTFYFVKKLTSNAQISGTMNLATFTKCFTMRIKFMSQLSWSDFTNISLNKLRKISH